jgi:hypothetical protein
MKLNLLNIYLFCFIMGVTSSFSQNTLNADNLLNDSLWNSLFPKRAGTYGVHPQGYTEDFYSYTNLNLAIDEMSDYLVQIRKKPGVWGELTTVTKKSTNVTYNYSQVDSYWYTNSTPEVVVNVDFADFINTSSATNNKRELAAFLANISKETTGGWQLPVGGGSPGDYAQWGLYFVHEVGYTSANGAGTYSQASTEYPPNPAKGYYGRGPIQLSWNYNYGQFSKFLYNDVSVLLNNPDLVQENGVLALKSAIWFWMMPQWPKPSCHQVMHDLWIPQIGEYSSAKMYKKGFAHVNNIINGGLECRSSSSSLYTDKVVIRSDLYKYYLSILGFSITQINAENSGDYSTLCFEGSTNAMQDYLSGNVLSSSGFDLDTFDFYPNPSVDFLNIHYSKTIESVAIYDLSGQHLLTLNPKTVNVKLDVSHFASGIYLVHIQSDNAFVAIKWIKK